MRRLILATICSLIPVWSVVPEAHADDVVVELFTSQGCSSCPPADELLGELAKKDGIIALSLHVDYWDYLGWKDLFGQAAFTERQRGYARAAGSTMIYTPQMVIGGQDQVVGTRVMEVIDAIQKHAGKGYLADVSATLSGTQVSVTAEPRTGAELPSGLVLQLVRYRPSETVAISRGENAGRNITYHNVVTSWTEITTWDGVGKLNLAAAMEGEEPGVVILQEGLSGPIVAAGRVD